MSEPRLVIVGAGPAGMAAAATLAAHGVMATVVDEAPRSGGQIYRRPPQGFRRGASVLYGFEAGKAQRLHRDFDALTAHIDYRPDAIVWHLEPGVLHLLCDGAPEALPFDRVLLATGAVDRVIPFDGWTLPGVFTLGGAQVALKYQGCAVGRRTVFLGSSPLLPLVAHQYRKTGADVVAVLDTAPRTAKLRALATLVYSGAPTLAKGLWYAASLAAKRVPYRHGVAPVRALGGPDGVTGLEYRGPDGRDHRLACDAVACGFGLKSEWQLADLAGCRFVFDRAARQWSVQHDSAGRTSVPEVYVAGDGAKIRGAEAAELAGRRAALSMLADSGLPGDAAAAARLDRRLHRLEQARDALQRAFPFPDALARSIPDGCIVCRCEAVTAGDIRRAVRELGADDVNRAKAFSRVGMGRCQGRICGPAAAEIVAEARGLDIADAGRLRGQPPVKPMPIAPLAGVASEDAA